MHAPAPPDPSRSPGELAKAVGVVVAIAVGALAAGAAAFWLVATYWAWILGGLAVVLTAGVALRVSRERDARERTRQADELRGRAHLDEVDLMTGPQFEALIADLLHRDGWHHVTVTGRAGDRGVDVLARAPDGRRIAFQCKRQVKPVSADRVRNLIGAVHGTYEGHHGVLVTSSTFTAPATTEAHNRITLINRHQLVTWMNGHPLTL